MKTVTFSHHKSPSQRIDTWQPIDRKGTMLSWTKPTLDQLIIRFNASKSINYATPMWNKHIYLTPNSVETNTHVSTLHSTIRKQLSKIGQSTEWHFNTQPPVGVQISLKYSTLKCTRLTSPQYPVRILGISSCHVEPDTVDPNHHNSNLRLQYTDNIATGIRQGNVYNKFHITIPKIIYKHTFKATGGVRWDIFQVLVNSLRKLKAW